MRFGFGIEIGFFDRFYFLVRRKERGGGWRVVVDVGFLGLNLFVIDFGDCFIYEVESLSIEERRFLGSRWVSVSIVS